MQCLAYACKAIVKSRTRLVVENPDFGSNWLFSNGVSSGHDCGTKIAASGFSAAAGFPDGGRA